MILLRSLPSLFCLSSLLLVTECKCASLTNLAPRLIQPLEFAGFTVSQINSREGVTNLLNQKIRIGTDDPTAYDFLSRAGSNNITVQTVNQYRAGIKAGYSAYTTADISAESWFIEANIVLSFMERARPSAHSFFTANDLKLLPVSILNWNEGDERKELENDAGKGMTLKDCFAVKAKHPIHAFKQKDNTMTFSDNTCDYCVTELARGDSDRDGCEDALIMIATYYQGGSGRGYQTWVASRTGPIQTQLKLTEVAR